MLWLEIQSTSTRNPDVAAVKRSVEASVLANVAAVFERAIGSQPRARVEAADLAELFLMLVEGVLLRSCGPGAPDVDATARRAGLVLAVVRDRIAALSPEPVR